MPEHDEATTVLSVAEARLALLPPHALGGYLLAGGRGTYERIGLRDTIRPISSQ
jgi:hypothetical protein